MSFTVEQECPQCGGAVELSETQHLVLCPWCDVKNFLSASIFHFILPYKEMFDDMVFVPYLRFRGAVYCCGAEGINYRVADLTRIGVPLKALPGSLGVRPQAMKLKFAGSGLGRSPTISLSRLSLKSCRAVKVIYLFLSGKLS